MHYTCGATGRRENARRTASEQAAQSDLKDFYSTRRNVEFTA